MHNYFIAKNEMLWKSDYTQEQIERFEIGDARFAYSEKVWFNDREVFFMPYGIFSEKNARVMEK